MGAYESLVAGPGGAGGLQTSVDAETMRAEVAAARDPEPKDALSEYAAYSGKLPQLASSAPTQRIVSARLLLLTFNGSKPGSTSVQCFFRAVHRAFQHCADWSMPSWFNHRFFGLDWTQLRPDIWSTSLLPDSC